jgi:phage gp36-like protein
MAYMTQADLHAAWGVDPVAQLLDDGTGTPDAARLSRGLDTADATINRLLRGRYRIPFDPFPTELRDIAAVLAWHALWQVNGQTPSDVQTRYEAAMKALHDLANGLAQLDASVARATASGSGQIAAGTRVMRYGPGWVEQYQL